MLLCMQYHYLAFGQKRQLEPIGNPTNYSILLGNDPIPFRDKYIRFKPILVHIFINTEILLNNNLHDSGCPDRI